MHFIEIHVGSLPVETAVLNHLHSLLDAGERQRAAAFKNVQAGQRYIAVRGLLRTTLVDYVDGDAASLRFTTNAHGKPELLGEALAFNLSHSADRLAIAVTSLAHIGVDIERVKPRPALAEVAARCFAAPELAAWQAVAAQQQLREFYRLWTKKEAFVKAVGRGLALGLEQCELDMATGQSFLHIPAEYGLAADWRVCELALDGFEAFCGAVVVAGGVGVGVIQKRLTVC
jgi:4'-phosphopantetheinyl transferase